MADLNAEIRSKIDQFLTEVSALVKKSALASVQDALGGGSAPAPRARAPRGRPRKAAGRIRRSAEDLEALATSVIEHVRANAGARLEQIGAAMKIDTAILKRPVAMLVAAKRLAKKGQKRGTQYFVGKAKAARKARKAGKKRGRKAA